jgi:hypothetical protein
MTTLLIQTESMPLIVNLPAIAPMTEAQFYEFCLANRDLRIDCCLALELEQDGKRHQFWF